MTDSDVHAKVREYYGTIAENFKPDHGDAAVRLYVTDLDELPEDVTGLSRGNGDPIDLADPQPGETIVDLGSGGGIDCFLAAKRVGQTGHVIGVDMTPQMIDQARANKARLGAENTEFRLGEIEHLPVADNSVDVVISNCVINLAPDKTQVLREAFRVLKPGGRLAVSDIVFDRPIPDALRGQMDAWVGCISGVLDVKQYVAALDIAGFEAVNIDLEEINMDGMEIELKEAGPADKLKEGKHLIVRTSDGSILIELGELEPSELPHPFSGKITARKPHA